MGDARNKGYTVEKATEPSAAHSYDWRKILYSVLNATCHILVVFVTVYIIIFVARRPNVTSYTNLHVLLCSLGYVLFMSEAIMSIADENLWSRCLSRRSRSHVHWVLQLTGTICSVSGVVIEYTGKEQRKRGARHFASNHALLGIVSVGSIVVLKLTGLGALFAVKLRKTVRPVVVKLMHNLLGIVCFALGMAAVIHAFNKKRYFVDVHETTHFACTLATYFIVVLALLPAARSFAQQFLSVITSFAVKWFIN